MNSYYHKIHENLLFNFYFLKNSFKFKTTFETVKLELVTILNRNNHSFLEAKIENFWIISNFLKSIFINSFLLRKVRIVILINKYFFPYFLHYFSFNHEETRKSSRLLNNSTSQEQHYITLNISHTCRV